MPNMSYVRFENTAGDLEDCRDTMLEKENFAQELSLRELEKAKWLISLCQEISENADRLLKEIEDAKTE